MSVPRVKHPRSMLVLGLAVLLLALGMLATLPASSPAAPSGPPVPPNELVLATTASLKDSGLLDALIPTFQRRSGFQVETIPVDSGQALEMGQHGNADLLLVRSPNSEQAFVASGAGVDRRPVMYEDSVVLGPANDPARTRGKGVLAALQAISRSGATWVSRRDHLDTNMLELELWHSAAGRDVQHEGWYVSTHDGMRNTLEEANWRGAYTLSDPATYLSMRDTLRIVPLVENDPLLRLPYHVIRVNPGRWPAVNKVGAQALADYLVSAEAQQIIARYGEDKYGRDLYVPAAPSR